MKDLRAIWTADHYQLLGKAEAPDEFYFAREKNGLCQVFLRSATSRKRKLIQVSDSSSDLFWCSHKNRLVEAEVTTADVLTKSESLLTGYKYGSSARATLEDLSAAVEVAEETLSTGATVIWLIPKKAKGWILSLHGGPESTEGTELRYGGLYRDLLRAGFAVAILNYRGSSNLSLRVNKTVWHNWKKGILEDFMALQESAQAHNLPRDPYSVFGVSFGGALALLIQSEFKNVYAVVSSPLLDLSHQRERAGAQFAAWFQSRFGKKDDSDFSFKCLISSSGPTEVFFSLEDEVVGSEIFCRLQMAKLPPGWFLHRQSGGHAPQTYKEFRERFGGIFQALIRSQSSMVQAPKLQIRA